MGDGFHHCFAVDFVVVSNLFHEFNIDEPFGFPLVDLVLAPPGADHGSQPVGWSRVPAAVDEPLVVESVGEGFQSETEGTRTTTGSDLITLDRKSNQLGLAHLSCLEGCLFRAEL